MEEPIFTAELEWNAEGLPFSRLYGDVYFSNEGGLDEARHVFLAGNALEQRMAQAADFTIGETGFGSGLNFLAAWQLWERVAAPDARLHFFSVEKHPMKPEDMARIHALFPETAGYAQALRAALPLPVPGFHRVSLAGGRVLLTLMYGDAVAMLQQQSAQADALFLDGFAPRLNPDLWSGALARQLHRLSAAGASIATFSTSSSTLEALSGAGFRLEKKPGFGRKKHMLTGYAGDVAWQPARRAVPARVTIIGGGLAGAATAHAFASRGVPVLLHEQKHQLAAGASGNPSAIFYPGVTVGWQKLSRLYYMGFSYSRAVSQRLAAAFPDRRDFYDPCGMLLFPKPREDAGRQAKVLAAMQPDAEVFRAVNRDEANAIAGIALPQGGLYFPASGRVDLQQLTHLLAGHPHIEWRLGAAVDEADRQIAQGEVVILCNGWEAMRQIPAWREHIHTVYGQTSFVAADTPAASSLAGLRCALSYGGYAVPVGGEGFHIGATYEKGAYTAAATTQQGLRENLGKLGRFLGEESLQCDAGGALAGWAALRSVTRDRLPLVGQVSGSVYANLAHASRGALSCALAGEYLASSLCGEPSPLPAEIAQMLSPHRFTG